MTKNDLLKICKPKVLTLEIPDLEQPIYLKSLTVGQRGIVGKVALESPETIMQSVLLYSLCNEDGERLFKDDEFEDIDAMDGKILTKLYFAACKHSKLRDTDIEELVKN